MKIYNLSLVLLILFSSNLKAQNKAWTYENSANFPNEISIVYDIVYEKELSTGRKKYAPNTRTIVFNKHFLIQNEFAPKTDVINYTKSILLDYDKLKFYDCTNHKNYKKAIVKDFVQPIKKATKQEGTKKILGLDCDEYITTLKGKQYNVYATKKFGIRYTNNLDVEGLVLEFPFYSKKYGIGKYVARNINYVKVPKTVFSLKPYTVYTPDEWSKDRKESTNSLSNVKYKFLLKKAPKIKLKTLDKQKISSKKLIGNSILVLNFSFIKSGACKNAFPYLNDLVAHYKDNPNVKVLSLFLDDAYDIEQFRKKVKMDFMVSDEGRWYKDSFEISRYPATIIIDKEGIVRDIRYGLGRGSVKSMMTIIDEELGLLIPFTATIVK